MNILILGSGGREHALAWKLARSSKVHRIFSAPGNAGTGLCGINLPVDPEDFAAIRKAVAGNGINMVIVGPEAPLVAGIHDFFLSDSFLRNIPLIGPVRKAAMLEGSKEFAKAFLVRHSIPTAAYRSFDRESVSEAAAFIRSMDPPYVIKADGLAAGKGVIITSRAREAEKELDEIAAGKFGASGNKIVIEQYLDGIELSAFIVTDGRSYKMLPSAKDYKRIGEGDTGLNTGGMGAISPVAFAGEEFMEKVRTRIIEPTLGGLSDEGIEYKGFLFFGLMNVNGDPYVIEYNVRLGDPETEAIIPRIKSDLFDLMEGIATGTLADKELVIDNRYVAAVMLVSGGYPGDYSKGYEITGLENTAGGIVFHSGTRADGPRIVTSGGRVLAVSDHGATLDEALEGAYRNAGRISFRDMYYRKDIGFDLRH